MSLSIKVDVRNGNLEQAMRVLKKKVQREGIIKDFRAKSVFEKPSEKKRRKKKEGIANYKKKQKKIKGSKRVLMNCRAPIGIKFSTYLITTHWK